MEWPLHGGSNWCRTSSTASGSQSYGYAAISAGSANTKTGWTELISAANNVHGFNCLLVEPATGHGSVRMALDIGIGASGSEQILIPDIFWLFNNYPTPVVPYPIHVPAGQAVSARMQGHTTPAQARILVAGLAGPFVAGSPCHRCVTYGVTTSGATTGTVVDAGGTAHTKSSWTEITSATTAPAKYVLVWFSRQSTSAQSAGDWSFDIAVGGSGSEQIILPDLWVGTGASADLRPMCVGPLPVDLPEGVRLSARCQSSLTSATHRAPYVFVQTLD